MSLLFKRPEKSQCRVDRRVFFIVLLILSYQANATWFSYQQAIMGTLIGIELSSPDQAQADICSQQVFAEMRRLDALMSPFIQQSELAEVNRHAATQAMEISQELFDLIARALEFSALSGGAFDISFSSVGYLYDYRQHLHPSTQQIREKLNAINYKNILLNKKTGSIFFTNKNTRIDLGGIAKGYGVDRGIKILQDCGIKNALLSAGGDSRIIGTKNGRPWIIGVQHPRDKKKVVVSMPLNDTAISTSGDYERFFMENGQRYHHILKPSTGRSVDETWSVTVLAENATSSDALSTTLFVLGAKQGIKLINSLPGIDAIIIDAHGKMFYSSGLMPPVSH